MIDIDGNAYKAVQIGNQVWMAENLKVTQYRNGTQITLAEDQDLWDDIYRAYCYYDNDPANIKTWGLLYNWGAVSHPSNIATDGWHVPTDDDWKKLEMAVGMSQSEADDSGPRGTNDGSKLAGNAVLWEDEVLDGNAAFGDSRFSVLPAGHRNDSGFGSKGWEAMFWTATGYGAGGWIRQFVHNSTEVTRGGDTENNGFSLRLVRD